MGKRSEGFERSPKDFYRTPREALLPLLPHLRPGTRFAEPCAGDGQLVDLLVAAGHHCVFASDIEPRRHDIQKGDALRLKLRRRGDLIWISNPPWTRSILHALIDHLCRQAPFWALFDADWAHTVQEEMAAKHGVPTAPELMKHCRRIVSVGRVEWIEGTGMTGKDNSAWYLFDGTRPPTFTEFFGPGARHLIIDWAT